MQARERQPNVLAQVIASLIAVALIATPTAPVVAQPFMGSFPGAGNDFRYGSGSRFPRHRFEIDERALCRATVSRCESDTWRASSCGRQQLADVDEDGLNGCDRAYRDQLEDDARDLPDDGTGKRVPYTYEDSMQSLGLHTHFDGLLQKIRVGERTPSYAAVEHLLDTWDRNGARVTSCGEYVYEKYYDYLEYVRRAASLGNDHRAVAELALSSGLLTRSLRTKEGTPAPAIEWSERARAKNDLFGNALRTLEYPEITFGSPRERARAAAEARYEWSDPSLLTKLRAPASRYTVNASFHERMFRTLRAVPNERFERARQIEREYVELVRLRQDTLRKADRALASNRCHAPEHGIVDVRCLRRETAALDEYWGERIRRIDALIEETLGAADTLGCLDNRAATVCDWAPTDLRNALSDQFRSAMGNDFERCVELTRGDFSSSGHIGGGFGGTDWRGGTTRVEEFFDAFEEALAEVDEFTITHEGERAIGETASDFAILGSPTAGVRMDYAAGYALSGFAGEGRSLCDMDAAFFAAFSAGTNYDPREATTPSDPPPAPPEDVGDYRTPGYECDDGGDCVKPNLISLVGKIESESEKNELDLSWDLSVFGEDVWNDNAEIPVSFDIVSDSSSIGTHTVRMRGDGVEREEGEVDDGERPEDDDGGDLGERLDRAGRVLSGDESRPDDGDSGDFDWSRREKMLEISGFITIFGPLRVHLAAGVAAELGVKFELFAGAHRAESCDASGEGDPAIGLKIGGRIVPFAKASAYAAASLDVWIVRAGIRADLNLIDARLPFTGQLIVGLGTAADSGDAELGVRIDAGLDFEMQLLSGEIVLFVESVLDDLIPGMPLQFTIFSWEGFKEKIEIIDTDDASLSLAVAEFAL